MSLNLNISQQAEARLTAAAEQRGIEVSSLVEQLVADHLPPVAPPAAPGKSVADMIREIGLVSFEPSDLSERADEYLASTGFGETKSIRSVEP